MRTARITHLLGALALGAALAAQSTGEIRGRLFDTDGAPLPFANVVTTVNGDLIGAASDFDGRFVLKPLPPGRYGVRISFVGLRTVEVPGVEVTADRATYLADQHLAGSGALDTLVVVAYRRKLIEKDDPSRMSILSEEFAKNPTKRDPIAFLGSTFAGVTPAPNGEGLYFRGSRTENMATYLDGIKVSGAVPRVPPSAISSVSVYTGGLPARYGDVTGGVVVIETKSYAEMLQEARRHERLHESR
jgi:hypothetical protein